MSQLPTAGELLERAMAAHAPRVAVVDGDRRVTYADLDRRSGRLAVALLARGAGAERPVATYVPNCSEFVEVDVACQRAGIPRVGIGDRLSGEEARYVLEHSGAAVLVADEEHAARVDVAGLGLDVLTLGREYEAALDGQDEPAGRAAVDPSATSFIMYTSGTTGRPKGAAHSQAGRVAAMLNMLGGELTLGVGSVFLHAAPLTHGSGSKLLAMLANGGTNVVLRKFTPEGFAAAIERHGGTHTFLVPTMIQRLLDAGDDVAHGVRRLEQISFGGSPISATTFGRAIRAFGPILTQVFGTSEAPHPISLLRPDDYRAAGDAALERLLLSAGRASLASEIRVVDEHGGDLGSGEIGELLVRSPSLMTGYWRDQQATAAVFAEGGWYTTGDLVSLSPDGLLTFQDRKRELIISGGLNVYPSEVERVITAHPGVAQAAVVGAPDDEWGEIVVAYVIPRDPGLTADDVIAWTRERLAGYKKPRRVVFLESLPLGSTGKVLKRRLRDALWKDAGRRVA